MTLPAKKQRHTPKTPFQPKPGPDHQTIGQRAKWAMARRAPSWTPAQLVAACQEIAGSDENGKPRILQQNVDQILEDRANTSKYAPYVAEALGVRAVWLQFGIGEPFDERIQLAEALLKLKSQ